MNMQTPKIYSVVDLFAGAGGLSYGFKQTGRFSVKVAFENNSSASKTYLKNHHDTTVYEDVCTIDYAEITSKFGNIDIVIGGPPCQGFSNANRQKNHTISQNNSLIKQFVKAVIGLNPLAFVMENVKMLRSDVHLFYIDKNDEEMVERYHIPTKQERILLLESEYLFDDAVAITENYNSIRKYIWKEPDYLILNVIYKMLNNPEKCKITLRKHKNKLLQLSQRLLIEINENSYIIDQNHRTANAIIKYFNDETENIEFIKNITNSIMIQRMLGKAKELFENNIVVENITIDANLYANVKAMTVLDYIKYVLGSDAHEYTLSSGTLCAIDFGVPQKRERFVIMGVKKRITTKVDLPQGLYCIGEYTTVRDAIEDIADEYVGYSTNNDTGVALLNTLLPLSELAEKLRNASVLYNHVATNSTETALARFTALKQGENFHNLAPELKTTYSDATRTQNTIYLRLKYDEPSGTVVNVRKSMWIHPLHNRALTIREAARLQTFPDSFVFCGTKDSQYQQIGNAVPPMLAKAIASTLANILD